MNILKKLVLVFFLFSVIVSNIYAANECSSTTNHNFGVNTTYTDSYSGNRFDYGDTKYYYFEVPSAGKVKFEDLDSDNDITYKYDLSDCPGRWDGIVLNHNNEISFSGHEDFNIRIRASSNNETYSFRLIFTPEVIPPSPTVDNVDDLCYENFLYTGTTCADMGICQGGAFCTTTIPLNNIGDNNLSSVNVYYDQNGTNGSMGNDCDVNPSGTCNSESNIDMGPIGILGTTTAFKFDDNITTTQTDASISTTPIVAMSCLSTDSLYASYVKNGQTHKGAMDKCVYKIGFQDPTYSVLEDINSDDNAPQAVDLTLTLSRPADFDIAVTYTTVDGTATSAEDYHWDSGTVTFLAGETEKIVQVDIYHDVAVELEESFFVELSNPTPSNGSVIIADYSPTEIIILEQVDVRICFEDDFNTPLDADWRLLYSNGDFEPERVGDRLRMTENEPSQATAVTKDFRFIAAENLITMEFIHYAYGGNGADGFAMVLYDSSVGANPTPGAFGGSLGYAQKLAALSDADEDTNGFEGGWLALGLDEYGRFSNGSDDCSNGRACSEGKEGGANTDVPNGIVIRGMGSELTGYTYIDGVEADPVLWKTSTNYSGGRFKMTIDSRDPNHLYINLFRDPTGGTNYGTALISADAITIQGATPEYLRLAITASTGGSKAYHELDDLVVKGVCRPYDINQSIYAVGFVDSVDTYTSGTYTDGNGPDLKTKVSNKGSYNFDAVYLGSDGSGVETYSPTGDFDDLPLTIEITLADTNCENEQNLTADDGSPFGWAEIIVGSNSGTTISPVTMPAIAMTDARLKLKALDWNSLFNAYDVSNSCNNSSTHGSLCGVPSCLGSAHQANEAFPPDGNLTSNNTRILTDCYGLAIDGSGSIGNDSPCQVNNYEGNCGGVKVPGVIKPSEYDNKVGCLACILDVLAESTCSVDHFAIRPNEFNLNSTNNSYPDLLRSAQDYNMTVLATDYSTGSPTQDYNQTSSILSTSNTIKWDKTPAIDNTLSGAVTLGDFNITNGTSTYNGTPGEVASFFFSDVGLVTLSVQDMNWTAIDSDDTVGSCTESGRYICGETNTTFIPHHFTFVTPAITNNNGNPGTFTYISNLDDGNHTTYDMAARINTLVEARNKLEAITQNFKTGINFYENIVSLNVTVVDDIHGDANTTSINNLLLGFGAENGDTNGTRTIIWNEGNTSKVLRFNFTRAIDTSVNPFDVNGSDMNVTISSMYTGTAPEGSATIIDDDSGKATATQNITMVYGRTHAGRQRYEGSSGTANIYYEGYCYGKDTKNVDCNKSLLLPFSPNLKRTDDIRWYVNESHKAITDGNIGTVKQKDGTETTTDDIVDVTNQNDDDSYNPATADLRYGTVANPAPYGYPYKTTMENNASSWLIYNEDNANAITNSFPVTFEYINNDWSGLNETKNTSSGRGANWTNKRLDW